MQWETVCQQALALANQSGVTIQNHIFLTHLIYGHLAKGDTKSAYKILNEIQQNHLSQTDIFYGFLLFLRARTDILSGKYISAYNNAKASIEIKGYAGFIFPVPLGRTIMGLSLALQGNLDAGLKEVIAGREHISFFESSYFDFSLYAHVAWIYLKKGDTQRTNEYLRKSFSSAAKEGIYSTILWYGPLMRDLSLHALEQNIEPAYVLELIRRNHLHPPDSQLFSEHWPWPVKIYCHGRFYILLNDQPVKCEIRPFDLLKVLPSFGGRDVCVEKIMDVLWPDAEGDQARSNFKTTLHRLRQSFTGLDVLVLKNHLLSINEQYVWVDTWAIAKLLGSVEDCLNSQNIPRSTELANKLLKHYRGHFLNEELTGWVIQHREATRFHFIRQCTSLAHFMEKEDQQMAITCYQRIIEIDPLTEVACQGMIRCYLAQGRRAEAKKIYQEFVDILAATSGVSPSAATMNLL